MHRKSDTIKSLHYTEMVANDVPVYIVEDHSVALKAWAVTREKFDQPLVLLTLDKHTDTHPALVKHAYSKSQESGRDRTQIIKELLGATHWNDLESINSLLPCVRNDEHIATAIDLGILEAAFVLSFNETNPTASIEYDALFSAPMAYLFHKKDELPPRPHNYKRPFDGVFYLPNNCELNCGIHSHACERRLCDAAIETWLLSDRISFADEMIRSIGHQNFYDSPYILDLDMDYFRTEKASQPDDAAEFLKLARGAVAISIATEPLYVESERLDSTVTAEANLEAILKLLEAK